MSTTQSPKETVMIKEQIFKHIYSPPYLKNEAFNYVKYCINYNLKLVEAIKENCSQKNKIYKVYGEKIAKYFP